MEFERKPKVKLFVFMPLCVWGIGGVDTFILNLATNGR